MRVRLDRQASNISLLVVLGIRSDGQKVLLSVRNMGGESEAAWRGVLDDLLARGLRTPHFLIIDGAAGARWLRSGPRFRPSAARFTSIGICWRTPRNGCTRRSPPTIQT